MWKTQDFQSITDLVRKTQPKTQSFSQLKKLARKKRTDENPYRTRIYYKSTNDLCYIDYVQKYLFKSVLKVDWKMLRKNCTKTLKKKTMRKISTKKPQKQSIRKMRGKNLSKILKKTITYGPWLMVHNWWFIALTGSKVDQKWTKIIGPKVGPKSMRRCPTTLNLCVVYLKSIMKILN